MDYQTILGWGALLVVLWLMLRRGGCCGGGHAASSQGHRGHTTDDQKGALQMNDMGHDGHQAHGETAVDPVCGMTVQKSTALKATVDGQDYFFCRPACRDEFLKGKGDGDGGHGTHGHQGHCC